jgi:hypothetical protein
MPAHKYDPAAFSDAMAVFKQHLRRVSPEAFELLFDPSVGFHYKPDAFEWTFLPFNSKDKYERISSGPFFDALGAAAKAAGFNLRLKCGDSETLIRLTPD